MNTLQRTLAQGMTHMTHEKNGGTCAATGLILAWGKDCRTQRFVGTNLINPVALKWLSMKQMMPRLYPFLDIGKGFFY